MLHNIGWIINFIKPIKNCLRDVMGEFHCPMGAPFYDDDSCINCDMCTAETDEQRVEASRKIREYLKSHAPVAKSLKKVAVCGKGGVGKSTITVLLANILVEKGFKVLALDTDESNPGLFRLFGFAKEPKPLITLLRRFASGDFDTDAGWLKQEQIAFPNIPVDYILNKDGLKFIMVGKIEDPFQGCACSMADLTRELMQKLVPSEKEIVVVDMEAGIESFGRGVERYMDTVLIVVEPSYESMALAEKIAYMAQGMGIARIKAVLNKVPTEKVRDKMVDELKKRGLTTLGAIFYDNKLNEASFEGTILFDSKAAEDLKIALESLFTETN
jgi:CO dehydrogenase maturation factor